jgi:hypothetical protein
LHVYPRVDPPLVSNSGAHVPLVRQEGVPFGPAAQTLVSHRLPIKPGSQALLELVDIVVVLLLVLELVLVLEVVVYSVNTSARIAP